MLPVLISVGAVSITSFGFFLALSILIAIYISWRLARVYEIDLERFLDVFFLTLICGLILSRLYFVATHLSFFDDPLKILFINKYPGFSFWGGILGGIFALKFFSKSFKLNFWQLLDFATVAFFLSAAILDIGCLLGSCRYGIESNLPFAVVQAGILGTRFPVQILEAILFLWVYLSLWKGVLRYHQYGVIFAKGMILLGVLGLLVEPLRADPEVFPFYPIELRPIWSVVAILTGIYFFYRQNKRSFSRDLKLGLGFFMSSKSRNYVISKLSRSCYNQVVKFKFAVRDFKKKFFKKLNVKSNPNNF